MILSRRLHIMRPKRLIGKVSVQLRFLRSTPQTSRQLQARPWGTPSWQTAILDAVYNDQDWLVLNSSISNVDIAWTSPLFSRDQTLRRRLSSRRR